MSSNQVIGAEALIRWNHSEKGLIPPGDFIPIAEDTQMIIPLGNWVVRETFSQLSAWNEYLSNSLSVSINISAYQLMEHGFVDYVKSCLDEFKINPNNIELELTETAVMDDISKTKKALDKLNTLGFKISIDDFGTGYSMLSYLKKLPVNSLKIDLEFVRDLGKNDGSEMIVKSIIDLANNFKLTVIAEGVEEKEQEKFLLDNGCILAQGYLYSKPLEPKIFIEFCQSRLPSLLAEPVKNNLNLP